MATPSEQWNVRLRPHGGATQHRLANASGTDVQNELLNGVQNEDVEQKQDEK